MLPYAAQAERFRSMARLLKTRDLRQLVTVGDLVGGIGGLVHSLQKERGVSNVFLASRGAQFGDRLAQATAAARAEKEAVCGLFDRLADAAHDAAFDARLFSRIASVLELFDTVDDMRQRIVEARTTAADATQFFNEVVSALLGVVFEASDAAADAEISRALIAMFNFMQGKEYAGRERATAAAGFSSGRFEPAQHARLLQLIDAQTRSFQFFARFATPQLRAFSDGTLSGPDMIAFERLRRIACLAGASGDLQGVRSEEWYDYASRRMDAMRVVELRIAGDLQALCQAKLAAAARGAGSATDGDSPDDDGGLSSIALVIGDADARFIADAAETGAAVYSVDGVSPRVGRSILDLVQTQERRLHEITEELEAARLAMNERKIIDRAKALLMTHRGASEQEAYDLLRKTAMSQNRRIKEVAEAVLAMADILKAG